MLNFTTPSAKAQLNPTRIELCDRTWNPVTGCTPISPGCANCYAMRMTKRYMHNPRQPKYRNGFKVTVHPHTLGEPLKLKRPSRIFVNSMSDLFHEDVPPDFILSVLDTADFAEQHSFLILTKRSTRLAKLAQQIIWLKNIWMGVTVEDNDHLYRIDNLSKTLAAVRFASFEPLLGPLPDLDVTKLDWAIVGGETGPGARPMDLDWAREIRDQCVAHDVPFFFKNVGGVRKPEKHDLLDGQRWNQFPVAFLRDPNGA